MNVDKTRKDEWTVVGSREGWGRGGLSQLQFSNCMLHGSLFIAQHFAFLKQVNLPKILILSDK